MKGEKQEKIGGKRIEVKAKRRKRKFMEKKYQGRGRTEGEEEAAEEEEEEEEEAAEEEEEESQG